MLLQVMMNLLAVKEMLDMKYFIQKLSSRKFLTAVAGVVMGLSMAFGLDEGAVSTIAGAVTSIMSVITYIYTEGKIDAAAVKETVDKVQDAIEEIQE